MKLKMSLTDLESLLASEGFLVVEQTRNPNDNGVTMLLDNGAIVNRWDSTTVNVQGMNQEPVRRVLRQAEERESVPTCGDLTELFCAPSESLSARDVIAKYASRTQPQHNRRQKERKTR